MAWHIQQTFGPSPRFPRACVELHFDEAEGPADFGAGIDRLRSAGLTVPAGAPPATLAEAIGMATAAVLGSHNYPRWAWGGEGANCWVCIDHPDPGMAEAAVVGSHGLLSGIANEPERVVASLLRIAAEARVMNRPNLQMMKAAQRLGLETAAITSFLPIYQVGQGVRSIHYCETASQADSFTSNLLSKDKRATLDVLNRFDILTAGSLSVGSPAQALEAVSKVGFPCVIKPVAGGSGRGVTAGIRSPARVQPAIAAAVRVGGYPILVERHVEGDDHRLTVVRGRLAWAYRRRPPYVVGDGACSIAELVDRENTRRIGIEPEQLDYLKPVRLDAAALLHLKEHYGLDASSVPARDAVVMLSKVANVARGGVTTSVTAKVHPDNRDLAERIAGIFRLDTVGIDIISADIGISWRETPTTVIEVNTAPGVWGMADACTAITTAFPRRLSGRIPCFVVSGDADYRREVSQSVMGALRRSRLRAGKATFREDSTSFRDVFRLTREVLTEAVVITCPSRSIDRLGFPLHACEILFAQDESEWAANAQVAVRTVRGAIDAGEVARLTAEAIEPFVSGNLGGPRPMVESLGERGDETGDSEIGSIRIWRHPAITAAPFWSKVTGKAENRAGMIGIQDILDAVIALTDSYLAKAGEAQAWLRFAFTHQERAWEHPYQDVQFTLPPTDGSRGRDALAHAIAEVNAIVATTR